MELERTGTLSVLHCGAAVKYVIGLIDESLSFAMPNAEWVESFNSGQWDGRIRLYSKRGGDLRFAGGLTQRVLERLEKSNVPDIDFVDRREDGSVTHPIAPTWGDCTLRPYQEEVVERACESDGGALLCAVRSGKTTMAARIVYKLKARTLFVAPSDALVEQALHSFKNNLRDIRITALGGGLGDDDTGDVVIASIQTLAARAETPWFKELTTAFGIVIIDEVHHLVGAQDAWRECILQFDAWRKFGLSGSLFTENESVLLHSEAVCGPPLAELPIELLTRLGFLVPLHVRFLRHDAEQLPQAWTPKHVSRGIVECAPRNERILAETCALATRGEKVLIDVGRVGHARALWKELRARLGGKRVSLMVGDDAPAVRKEVMASFSDGSRPVIVSTLLGEGVDVPDLKYVVNGEGGSASPSTIQRLRNLTPAPGKTEAVLIDFVDHHHSTFVSWTRGRLGLYRAQKVFTYEVEPRVDERT